MHCFNQFAFWDPGSLLYAESIMEFISQSTEDKCEYYLKFVFKIFMMIPHEAYVIFR